MDLDFSQQPIRKRFKEILDTRKELEKDDSNIFVSTDNILQLKDDDIYIRSDNIRASLIGFYNVDKYSNYYAPVENFSDEELDLLK